MTHHKLFEQAEEAIDELFSDQSVSPKRTLEDMESLRVNIEIKILALTRQVKSEGI